MHPLRTIVGVAILCGTSIAQHLSKYCPSSDVCYQLNIPLETTRSGSGDIYFQISGPTSYSWIGLGQGSQMAGANIFVIYSDGRGNVTLSPRLGTGHVEPMHDTTADVTLLEGSGVANGRMVANVRCGNCARWQGGSMDFSSSSAGWIHAALSGSSIDSTSPSAGISQHSEHGSFTWDLTKAQGGSDVNPFVTAAGSSVSTGPSSSSSGGASDGSGGDDAVASVSQASDTMVTAHGTLASIVFLALFPIGAIVTRIPGLQNAPWIHAAIQIFGYCAFIAAAGLGIYIATIQRQLMAAHPIIGMVLLSALFFQPLFGWLHHRFYKRKQRRTAVSYVHVWEGRLGLLLGMINGGLGLKLASVTNTGYIAAYGVVAGVMGTAYIAVAAFGETKRQQTGPLSKKGQQ